MAAPAPTPRTMPSGFKMPDGFKSLITFSKKPNIQLWEFSVQPTSIDAGEPIDTTTMHNVRARTMASRRLLTFGPGSMECMYDPDVYGDIVNLIGDDSVTITETYADGTSLAYYGFMKSFKRKQLEEGKRPEATVEFVPTNWDKANNVEQMPVITYASGT